LSQLKEKVKSLPTDDHIKEIFELIRDNIDQDQNWKKFRVEFTSIHPRFFDNLTTKFPDLSENNVQLCAYLRISLSSKEIANLMSISVSSVNKNRQRLRKKLYLEAETDLSEFLATLD
jgi:DNA-binding CsgD family transcriptional regulator